MLFTHNSICLLTFLCGFTKAHNDVPVLVKTLSGDVLGSTKFSKNGGSFYAFRGIPYAHPPVGDLRFQPPIPAESWSGILNATQNRNACIQWNDTINGISGDEDCLFLYVYTPNLAPNVKPLLPVLVFIHGGAFAIGSPHFSPYRFMDHDVILVTIGYRLGPFGFLCVSELAVGNNGLLDQVLALKWIQSNIEAFGGDRNKVTLFGNSAGGASVSYHQLSPLSTGLNLGDASYRAAFDKSCLFHGAICQSASAISPWTLQRHPQYWTKLLASTLRCPLDYSKDLIQCLKQKSATGIVTATKRIHGNDYSRLPFAPCIETETKGRFLTEPPMQILSKGKFNKVPVILGTDKDEGVYIYELFQSYFDVIDNNFYNNIIPKLIYLLTRAETNLINVSYAIKEEYFDQIDVNNHTQVERTAIALISDAGFNQWIDLTASMLAEQQIPVYMYSFEYFGSGSYYNFTGEGEVSHSDEIFYLFDATTKFTPEDQFISDQLIRMWVNFATNLNPNTNETGVWIPVEFSQEVEYLKIATNSCTMETGFLKSRMKFWEENVASLVECYLSC